ncbi:hypothetical protein IJS77_04810 [bacterium]|nr:hypothetical protein [bacterium]
MLLNIWNEILKSNTFNFIIFLVIIALILKKINIAKILENIKQNTENSVNNSIKAKKDSQTALIKSENKMKGVEKDVEKIITESKATADIMASNIVSGAKGQIEIIQNNAKKVIVNDLYKTKKSLSDFAIKESIQLTRDNIKNKLNENKGLHQKYIDEALNELEKINF